MLHDRNELIQIMTYTYVYNQTQTHTHTLCIIYTNHHSRYKQRTQNPNIRQ